ncbi:DUF4267 domain-containing protein [Actinomycetospora chiangmaiensis]|uniref:DUF4267 domain-containing protein n=1 Tax=Actinomycetospora chiangmaiensis TaxID=402650 RepID=UPI00039EEAC5|nr:DUF4267 domain-containing protein [Actinomycetospora chiangmaiensis]
MTTLRTTLGTSRSHRAGVLGLGAAAVAIIPIGVRFLAAPKAAQAGYGLTTTPENPYGRAKGIRDIATGLMTLAVLARGDGRLAGQVGLAAATIPLGDMVVVLRSGGRPQDAFGIHGATCLVMAASAAALLADRRRN